MKIFGQRILLTGAGGGIGGELARMLAEKGAELALVDRDADRLQQLKSSLQGYGNTLHTLDFDLAAPDAPQKLAIATQSAMGGVDILINCAGLASFGNFAKESPNQIESLWRVNVLVPIQLARAMLPQMLSRGSGRIVNIGSIFGSIGFAYFTNYSASKFAMRGFSEALRRELEGTGIDVTYVAPRYTRTPFNEGVVARMAVAVGMNSDDPTTVAEHVVRAIEKDRKDYYIGWPECLFVRINAILPRLVDSALRKQNHQIQAFAVSSQS